MSRINLSRLTQVSLLVAIEIVLSRFLSISTPIVRIGFGFVPIVLIAILHGPVFAGIGAALADFLGAILFPIGAYFPGFTLVAGLVGICYGLFLYQKPRNTWRILLCVSIVCLPLQLGLDTLWLMMITGKGYLVLLPTRAIKSLIMIPIQVLTIRGLCYFIAGVIKIKRA
jgi:ECF transporter S component (folate family)